MTRAALVLCVVVLTSCTADTSNEASSSTFRPTASTTTTVASPTTPLAPTSTTTTADLPCVAEVERTPDLAEDEVGIALYCFGEDALVGLVPRSVPPGVEDEIQWTLAQLIDNGATPEERAEGYFSVFTDISMGALLDVLTEGDTLVVNLDPAVQNETGFFTLAGGVWALVSATGLQFPGISEVVVLVGGVEYCEVVDDLACAP